jgi:hypothetical protein
MSKIKLCECGCGLPVKPGNRFIHGHNRRSKYVLENCREEYKEIGKKISKLHNQVDGPYGDEYKKKQSIISKRSIQKQKKDGIFEKKNRKISIAMMGNKNGCLISDEVKTRKNQKKQYKKDDYIERHSIFVKEEEIRDRLNYILGMPGIEVRCKYCRRWFTPTRNQLDSRIRAIEYNLNGGGCFFYCSEDCKEKCPYYNLYILSVLKPNHERPTSADNEVFRQEVLKRANYKCEYCGEEATIVHHSRPFKLEPFFTLDPDYGIAVCLECHNKFGHKGDCSAYNLAKQICR